MQQQLRYRHAPYPIGAALLLIATPLLANAQIESIDGFLVQFVGFLSDIVLPTLFGIAFLVFLINIVRYFILEGANPNARDAAKRSALYGIAAFVFLLIIWSIVSLLVDGIGLNRDQALCPDYIGSECGESGIGGGYNAAFSTPDRDSGGSFTGGGGSNVLRGGTNDTTGSYTGGAGSNTGGSGRGDADTTSGNTGTGTNGDGSNDSGTNPQYALLAELLFGTGKDAARLVLNDEAPRSTETSPAMPSQSSCVAGISLLQQASRQEHTQAGYLAAVPSGQNWRWTNVTDAHSANLLGYDADHIADSTEADLTYYLAHTHPKQRADSTGLVINAHGPSVADMQTLCNEDSVGDVHIIANWNGVWKLEKMTDACPQTEEMLAALPILETYAALASLDSTTRNRELEEYVASNLPPTGAKTHFQNVLDFDWQTINSTQVLERSQLLQDTARIEISYYETADAFCNSV